MGNRKHSNQWKIERVQEYLRGEGSYKSIAKAYGIDQSSMELWVAAYREHGIDAFSSGKGNKRYSHEFKFLCVEAVLSGELSIRACVAKYGISDTRVLRSWISKYNANRELKDYDPKRKSVKKSSSIVLSMVVIIKVQQPPMMFPIRKCTVG